MNPVCWEACAAWKLWFSNVYLPPALPVPGKLSGSIIKAFVFVVYFFFLSDCLNSTSQREGVDLAKDVGRSWT